MQVALENAFEFVEALVRPLREGGQRVAQERQRLAIRGVALSGEEAPDGAKVRAHDRHVIHADREDRHAKDETG
jgi:hypothetical protein